MTSPPPDFSVRLTAHAQGLHDIQESGRLSPTESNFISEALDIIHLMIERPDFSHALMSEITARELSRRNKATIQQAAVIWSRVGTTMGEAVETAREIGRVSPEMQVAVDGLALTLERNMTGLSQSEPLIRSMDKVELASQQLRAKTRQARAQFHGTPHLNHEHGALLADLAIAWKTPTSPQAFLEAATHMKKMWSKVSEIPRPSPRSSPGRG